ncbi:MAG: 5'/3'-nucleotidase SurE [Candidatus Omnitrophota bacterium]|nr:5'/3'-nucleotidase SurE [Candidatus Omnitrophota bacterium]
MHILVTNDDGIYADGIYALCRELKKIGRVTVVAPDSERSSVGHGITLSNPILFRKVNRKGRFFGYGISGTPADCVKFGVRVVLKRKPDILVSGINLGANDGYSVFYSGTVAGAREGALLGIPSMAVSLATFKEPDFRYAARIGAKIAKRIGQHPLRTGTFLNVNVPSIPQSKIRGVRITRQGLVPIHGDFSKRVDPNLRAYYWMTGKAPKHKNDMAYDTYALNRNYVTVSPIHCDMTDAAALKECAGWHLRK